MTIKEFAEWLLTLPPEKQGLELHCVSLCGSSVKKEELRVFDSGWDGIVCIDDNGDWPVESEPVKVEADGYRCTCDVFCGGACR